MAGLHSAVADWFRSTFDQATPVQQQAWQSIIRRHNTLIAAPTGSGKTLAGFLAVIDSLVKASRQRPLDDRVYVVYVSPLKALSNDIERNLRAPLEGIEAVLADHGDSAAGIRAAVRTGDTTSAERHAMRRRPPHILVTTPESLFILLTSDSGRSMLAGVETVIVDEIHALANSKRGAHLALTLARLKALVALVDLPGLSGLRPRGSLLQIGMSATQKPLRDIADFLTAGDPDVDIIDGGHRRDRDLAIELPSAPLAPVMATDVWTELYDRLAELVEAHHTTLIFVNNRRLAERAARALEERLGEDAVTAHHGSLSKDHRLRAERRLKQGELRVLVATASLELGIDIGHIDLVCQLGSPRAINAFLQRVGRAGHGIGGISKGRLFPLSRDDLVECAALLRCCREGELDRVHLAPGALDVLAQQIVATVAAAEWPLDALYECCRGAWPYRELSRDTFDGVLHMLAQGFSTRRGRRGAYLHLDQVNRRVRGRRGARMSAFMNGGTIPDQFDYDVMLMPDNQVIGNLNEDFAFESIPGDIFQLGNTSYRVLRVEQGRVLVEDAKGQPPSIPFWFGDAPGRSDELSQAVSRLRGRVNELLDGEQPDDLQEHLQAEYDLEPAAAAQIAEYLSAAHAALGCVPTRERLVVERFFDDAGDMHLVIHAPYGARINRAWGLALRKRFCRQFNFELQASALEDSIILSLGETHSFVLDEVLAYLKSDSLTDVLTQAVLDAPVFEVQWRWNATIALAVKRMVNGKKLPPQFQRNAAEDLVAVVFPDQIACLENIQGARDIPDHPLVRQTLADCLHGRMDLSGLKTVYGNLEQGTIKAHCRDLTGPSPLAREIINARPYAFLDDGDAENRRTRAIGGDHREADPAALARLRPDAVSTVRQSVWPQPRDADELHDGLLQLGFMTNQEVEAAPAGRWLPLMRSLVADCRATQVTIATPDGQPRRCWVAAERLNTFLRVYPEGRAVPPIQAWDEAPDDRDLALRELLRARLSLSGPVSEADLVACFGLAESDMQTALLALEQEGYAVRTRRHPTAPAEWCERGLLARIHRLSRSQRRAAVRPVSVSDYLRFLARWHGLDGQGAHDVPQALALLEGWAAPLAVWERQILPGRVPAIDGAALDRLFLNGQWVWLRGPSKARSQLSPNTPFRFVRRSRMGLWCSPNDDGEEGISSTAAALLAALARRDDRFAADLADDLARQGSHLLAPQLQAGLQELIARGLVHSDSITSLRALLRSERAQRRRYRGRRGMGLTDDLIGRWSRLLSNASASVTADSVGVADYFCRLLLRRYGVVCRGSVARESGLPPWRELLFYLRRLEDRGEVKAGRWIDGITGEQFALPEAAGLLKQVAAEPLSGTSIHLAHADPMNVTGILPRGSCPVADWVLQDGRPVVDDDNASVQISS